MVLCQNRKMKQNHNKFNNKSNKNLNSDQHRNKLRVSTNIARSVGYIWGTMLFLDALFKEEIRAANFGIGYIYFQLSIFIIGIIIIIVHLWIKNHG